MSGRPFSHIKKAVCITTRACIRLNFYTAVGILITIFMANCFQNGKLFGYPLHHKPLYFKGFRGSIFMFPLFTKHTKLTIS